MFLLVIKSFSTRWIIGRPAMRGIEKRGRLVRIITMMTFTRAWGSDVRYFWETIKSWTYWRYVLFSFPGMRSLLAIYGAIYLLVESLDFFNVYTKSKYAACAFLIFIVLSAVLAIVSRRPIRKISIKLPQKDVVIEVRIGDLFDVTGAIMISTNTVFES